MGEPRFAMSVLMAFAAAAMVLAAVGLYGVLSYQIGQRRRETGVRAALGASRAIVALVIREGLGVTAAGVLAGLPGAAWLARLMTGLASASRRTIPWRSPPRRWRCWPWPWRRPLVPARRAASIDPVAALKCE